MNSNQIWASVVIALALINFVINGDIHFTVIMVGLMLLFRINDLADSQSPKPELSVGSQKPTDKKRE